MMFSGQEGEVYWACWKSRFLQADQKCPDARRPKSWGVRRTWVYVATTKDEGNAADGRFSTACILLTLTADVETFPLRTRKGTWFWSTSDTSYSRSISLEFLNPIMKHSLIDRYNKKSSRRDTGRVADFRRYPLFQWAIVNSWIWFLLLTGRWNLHPNFPNSSFCRHNFWTSPQDATFKWKSSRKHNIITTSKAWRQKQ